MAYTDPQLFLLGAVVVLVILLAWHVYQNRQAAPKGESFVSQAERAYLNARLDSHRGTRAEEATHPARPRSMAHTTPAAIAAEGRDEYFGADTSLRGTDPELIAQAEREAWGAEIGPDHTPHYDTENAYDNNPSLHHSAPATMDYGEHVKSLVVDPRTEENHRQWVKGALPYAGTARGIDTLDVGDYIHFQGLRRPQAITQSRDSLFVTEIGTDDLTHNPKFNFRG